MIAKDEAAVITRALDSAKPLIDYVLVEDTGSTDGTQDIVRDWLGRANLDGAVIDEPWQNFAYNRSHVLAALRERKGITYGLIIDADDTLEIGGDPHSIKQHLAADAYTMDIKHGSILHQRTQLCSNKKPFRYRGVVHEFLDCTGQQFTSAHLSDVAMVIVGGGARSRERGPETYRHDAELLEQALIDGAEPDLNTRYMFYLAQSYRDGGMVEEAMRCYQARADMTEGWNEEAYVALLNVARLREQSGQPLRAILEPYKRAIALNPKRAEAYHGAAKACRLAEQYHEAYVWGQQGLRLALAKGLFIEPWIYRYGMLDEYAVSAYWAGHRLESWLASHLLLRGGDLDETTRKRVETNARFAAQG